MKIKCICGSKDTKTYYGKVDTEQVMASISVCDDCRKVLEANYWYFGNPEDISMHINRELESIDEKVSEVKSTYKELVARRTVLREELNDENV